MYTNFARLIVTKKNTQPLDFIVVQVSTNSFNLFSIYAFDREKSKGEKTRTKIYIYRSTAHHHHLCSPLERCINLEHFVFISDVHRVHLLNVCTLCARLYFINSSSSSSVRGPQLCSHIHQCVVFFHAHTLPALVPFTSPVCAHLNSHLFQLHLWLVNDGAGIERRQSICVRWFCFCKVKNKKHQQQQQLVF